MCLKELMSILSPNEFLYLHFNSTDNKNLSELIEEYYNKRILKIKRDIDGIHVFWSKRW